MEQQYIEDLSVEEIASQSTDSLLESLSLPIMENSIRDQIENGFNTTRDFLDIVLRKFKAIEENADDDSKRGIRSEIVDWANDLIHAIVNQYGLGYNNINEESVDGSLDILETLYHFFVLDKHQNTINFFIQYIDCNKKEIANQMKLNARGGDITTMANRKKNIPKDNVPILSNLDEVIQYISSEAGISSDEFLDLIDDGDYYIANVISYYNQDMLMGDFYQQYISGEVGSYADDISMALRSEIRTHLANI